MRGVALVVLCAVAKATTLLSQHQFARLCGAAMRSNRPLELRNRTVALDAPHKVGAGDELEIWGPGTIVGGGHSVFQVGGSARPFGLRLRDLVLRHVASADRSEQRALGACVFARGRGAVDLERCVVSSEAGFGLWLVQRSAAALRGCEVQDTGRTAITLFNDASLSMDGCRVADATPHGICARGATSVSLTQSTVENAAVRAIYCYLSPSLVLADVVVSGTRDATAAAVQVEALRPGDAATVVADGLRLEANRGRGLSVAGNVDLRLVGGNNRLGPVDDAPARATTASPRKGSPAAR